MRENAHAAIHLRAINYKGRYSRSWVKMDDNEECTQREQRREQDTFKFQEQDQRT